MKNDYLYNDKELWDDADLNWYDYGFRNYDAQIARFTQLDPLTWDYPELTNYQYASDEPIANVDMDGLEAEKIINQFIAQGGNPLQEVVVTGLKQAAKTPNALSITGQVGKGLGKSLWGTVKGVSNMIIHPINTAENLIKLADPANQLMLGASIYQGVQNTIEDFKNGDANTKEELIGEGIGEGVQLFAGGAGWVGKAGKIGKLTEGAGKVGKVAEAAKGGVQYTKSSLKFGQEMHKAYKVGADGIKEFRLPSGKRIDFLDINNRIIYELKPFNPRAMKAGQKQLDMYLKELQTIPEYKGFNWKTVLDTY